MAIIISNILRPTYLFLKIRWQKCKNNFIAEYCNFYDKLTSIPKTTCTCIIDAFHCFIYLLKFNLFLYFAFLLSNDYFYRWHQLAAFLNNKFMHLNSNMQLYYVMIFPSYRVLIFNFISDELALQSISGVLFLESYVLKET